MHNQGAESSDLEFAVVIRHPDPGILDDILQWILWHIRQQILYLLDLKVRGGGDVCFHVDASVVREKVRELPLQYPIVLLQYQLISIYHEADDGSTVMPF